jgi:hypothetical protein
MSRWVFAALGALFGACAEAQTFSDGLTAESIGPIRFGMSAADIEALGLTVRRDTVVLEGDAYPRMVVEFENGDTVEVLFWQDRLSDLRTNAAELATDRGARVGASLRELRSIYPDGEVNIGREEGRYFNFETPEHGFFDFDTTGVPASCFDYNGQCPDLGDRRSVSYRIRDISG